MVEQVTMMVEAMQVNQDNWLYVIIMAITEMAPDLIWAPDFFGPQEIWSPRNLVPKKFGP